MGKHEKTMKTYHTLKIWTAILVGLTSTTCFAESSPIELDQGSVVGNPDAHVRNATSDVIFTKPYAPSIVTVATSAELFSDSYDYLGYGGSNATIAKFIITRATNSSPQKVCVRKQDVIVKTMGNKNNGSAYAEQESFPLIDFKENDTNPWTITSNMYSVEPSTFVCRDTDTPLAVRVLIPSADLLSGHYVTDLTYYDIVN